MMKPNKSNDQIEKDIKYLSRRCTKLLECAINLEALLDNPEWSDEDRATILNGACLKYKDMAEVISATLFSTLNHAESH